MVPKVSVIVPIYRVEPYLERCLDSLRRQTLREIEIILIDDGSPDRCGQIADRYAREDDRFRVVHQQNGGLSAARNRGIDLAMAPYLMFVDSDDWVEPDYCRIPYEAVVEHGADLVLFGCWRDGFWLTQSRHSAPLQEGVYDRAEAMGLLYHGAGVSAWNKLYHGRLFEGVRYPEGYVAEDVGTTCRLVQNAQKVYVSNALLYHYCCRGGGIMQSPSPKSVMDKFTMLRREAGYLAQFGYEELSKERQRMLGYGYLISCGTKAAQAEPYLRWFRQERQPAPVDGWQAGLLIGALRLSPALFDLICTLFGKRRWRRRARQGK